MGYNDETKYIYVVYYKDKTNYNILQSFSNEEKAFDFVDSLCIILDRQNFKIDKTIFN